MRNLGLNRMRARVLGGEGCSQQMAWPLGIPMHEGAGCGEGDGQDQGGGGLCTEPDCGGGGGVGAPGPSTNLASWQQCFGTFFWPLPHHNSSNVIPGPVGQFHLQGLETPGNGLRWPRRRPSSHELWPRAAPPPLWSRLALFSADRGPSPSP